MKTRKLFIVLILIILVFTLSSCKSKEDTENELLREKTNSSIKYLDTTLISILNKLNNISFENFYVTTEKVDLNNNKQNISNSSDESQSSDSSGGKEESSNSESGSGGESKQGESDNSSKPDKSLITVSDMKSHNILLSDKNSIDWDNIKADIENLYSSWNAIIIDLYKIGINNDDILNFSAYLDEALSNIKQEKRENALTSLASLYNMIPKFKTSYSNNNTEINILWTKAHVVKAYSSVGIKDWNTVMSEMGEAEKAYSAVISDAEFVNSKSYNTNKTYVCLKELQNSVAKQDEDIFYIKYKNFMEEINML